jgi:hypothetical protein
MSIKKLSYMLLGALSLTALLSGCGSDNKNGDVGSTARVESEGSCIVCHSPTKDSKSGTLIVEDYFTSSHNPGNSAHATGCQGCHGGGSQHNGAGPFPYPNPLASDRCITCHIPLYSGGNDLAPLFNVAKNMGFVAGGCAHCHTASGIGSVHGAGQQSNKGCIDCHDIAAPNHGASLVNDNNGVRAITTEFAKWSHHVTGVTLNDAHCAACHLEGTVVSGKVVVDPTKHMVDAKTHLRDTTANTDADFAWDPSAPNHSGMDIYCMSCHDANGATSPMSTQIQAYINSKGLAAAGKTASAKNPFGDTISNRYDKMQRPAVVNVDDQFDTTNNSHHAVKGPRYSGRTRTAGPRQIADPVAFTNNSSAALYGTRSTIYDSVNSFTKVNEFATNPAFNALYVPLANAGGETAPRTGAASLGDDSTLHCGDCHTVGQYKANATVNAAGVAVATVIGAHGSNNEYMLRNDKGTDERHTQDAYLLSAGTVVLQNPNAANLVCFNCHSYKRYGSVYAATGAKGPHAGEYDASGRCNGVGNTIPFNGYTTGTATDGTQFQSRFGEKDITIPIGGSVVIGGKTYSCAATSTAPCVVNAALGSNAGTPAFAPGFPLNFANAPGGVQAGTYIGEQEADFGNVFGIQCNNCHNSGIGNGYGGIHGSANNSPGTANTALAGGAAVVDPSVTGGAYVDGMGNTQKVQRFLPGLGNVMHVPGTLGGFTGGVDRPSFFGGTAYTIKSGAIANDANWEQIGWKQIAGNPTGGATGLGAGCYTLNDEGTGSSLDKAASPTQGLKGQSYDGGATTPNAAKTWGGCDDHTGQSVGGADHGFQKRINRPVTY